MQNAQLFGAEVVIISDYRDYEQAVEEEEKYSADINGALVEHIPAFEIEWSDAKEMIQSIRGGEEVVYVKASLDVTSPDNSVEVDLWYSTSLDLGLHLSTELAAMSTTFSVDHANQPLFTPRIASYRCLQCTEEFRLENCVSDGLYCAFTP